MVQRPEPHRYRASIQGRACGTEQRERYAGNHVTRFSDASNTALQRFYEAVAVNHAARTRMYPRFALACRLTLIGPHLRPGAHWGPNRHGCCHLVGELFGLKFQIAVTRTGRFVVSRSEADLSRSTF